MHWRHVLVWTGSAMLIAGPMLTIASVIRHWRGSGASVGLAMVVAGIVLIAFGYMLRSVGTVGEIYHTGYDDGYDRGHREGRREGRPVLVSLAKHRKTAS